MTQPEFAKIVGISHNSLSRYENGTSSVSTELVDRICQKFNVSYVDIVGEERMLTPVEDYQLTLKIEVIKDNLVEEIAELDIKLNQTQEKIATLNKMAEVIINLKTKIRGVEN